MKMENSENGEVDEQGYYILVLQYRNHIVSYQYITGRVGSAKTRRQLVDGTALRKVQVWQFMQCAQ